MTKWITILAIASIFMIGSANAQKVNVSWYGPGFHGKKTASGKTFNQWAYTAAHPSLPFGTRLQLTHKGRSIIVTVNDRGPFVRGRQLDISKGAARALHCPGVCRMDMKIIG